MEIMTIHFSDDKIFYFFAYVYIPKKLSLYIGVERAGDHQHMCFIYIYVSTLYLCIRWSLSFASQSQLCITGIETQLFACVFLCNRTTTCCADMALLTLYAREYATTRTFRNNKKRNYSLFLRDADAHRRESSWPRDSRFAKDPTCGCRSLVISRQMTTNTNM